MIYVASSLIGAVIGLISVSIFAVALRGIEKNNPQEAVKALITLVSVVLGGGAADYVVMDVIIETRGTIAYYMIGLAVIFIPIGLWTFIDWRK